MKNFKAIILGTAVISVSMLSSAAVKTWDNDSTDGNWDTATNWNTDGVPGTSDQAIINNGDTVTKTGDLDLRESNNAPNNGIQLTNGILNVNGSIISYTNGGAGSGLESNLGVSGGATIGTLGITGSLVLGFDSSSSSASSSFNIYTGSSLTADTFQGKHRDFGGGSGLGGWELNVSGGSLDTTTFNFSDFSNSGDSGFLKPKGQLTIGSTGTATGGTVIVGTMSDDWDDRSNQYVLFNDALGSLTFGKTNWALEADVQGLIDNDFIRKDASVTDGFNIADNGSTWTVTIIPEPSTFAMLIVAGMGLLVTRRRLRR